MLRMRICARASVGVLKWAVKILPLKWDFSSQATVLDVTALSRKIRRILNGAVVMYCRLKILN